MPRAATMQPARRRRGRRGRRVLIVLVVLAGLLVGADFALAAYAEHTLSQKMRERLALTTDPSVRVRGFPFTTQALRGDYRHISLHASGVRVGDTLRDVELAAELWDVRAPLAELVSGNLGAVEIGRLEGQVRIKATDIARVGRLARLENLRIEPSTERFVREGSDPRTNKEGKLTEQNTAADADAAWAAVRLSASVQIAGVRKEISAFAVVTLDGETIRIDPRWLQLGAGDDGVVIPPQVQQQLLPDFQATIDPGDLPFAVTPTSIAVESGALVVTGTARNVTLS